MSLGKRIDALLRNGFPVSADTPEIVALSKDHALALLRALAGTKIAIRQVEVYLLESWGPVPAEVLWSCERHPSETASDYADRSRAGARRFVETHRGEGKALFALDMDLQQDAA